MLSTCSAALSSIRSHAITTSRWSTRCACAARRSTSGPVAARFLAFFVGEGERHFAQEEELLLPVIPGGTAAAGERLIAEHAEIRDQARALGERLGPVAAVRLGELLASHIRFEERELFPMLEQRLSPAALADIGRRLHAADA